MPYPQALAAKRELISPGDLIRLPVTHRVDPERIELSRLHCRCSMLPLSSRAQRAGAGIRTRIVIPYRGIREPFRHRHLLPISCKGSKGSLERLGRSYPVPRTGALPMGYRGHFLLYRIPRTCQEAIIELRGDLRLEIVQFRNNVELSDWGALLSSSTPYRALQLGFRGEWSLREGRPSVHPKLGTLTTRNTNPGTILEYLGSCGRIRPRY